jgi:tetratricopeptide (TPR) repeat protein
VAAEASRDPTASTMVAEMALERGDCRVAAETYAAAAQRADIPVARRSSEVALACEHLPAAWDSVKRWRTLAPSDKDAAAIYATVALKLYRVNDARTALTALLKKAGEDAASGGKDAPAGGPSPDGAKSGDDAKAAGDGGKVAAADATKSADALLGELAALFLQEADSTATFAALSGALDVDSASPTALALMAELALEAYDVKRAERFAELSLKRDPASYDAKHVLSRAYVMKGDAAAALAAAREATKLDPKRGQFEVAETLASLDRLEDARFELERLRSTDVAKGDVDRRLALLAFQGGDFKEAQRRFADLATSDDATDGSLLYLADIAARQRGRARWLSTSLQFFRGCSSTHACGRHPSGTEGTRRSAGPAG